MNIEDVPDKHNFDRSNIIVSTKDIKILITGNDIKGGEFDKELRVQDYALVKYVKSEELFEELDRDGYHIVIIDMVAGDIDVVYAIQRIYLSKDLPYIIVRLDTDNVVDRILTLELGADDCILANCDIREIRARLRSLFRRRLQDVVRSNVASIQKDDASQSSLTSMGWVLDKSRRHILSPSGDKIPLTNSEYSILYALFKEPGVIKDRTSLRSVNAASDEDYNDKTINAFLSRLRRKMSPYGGGHLVESVRGQGYRLNVEEP